MTPSLREEKKLWRKGYKRVVGLDEAGRGPLAGPVVAGAVMIRGKPDFHNLKDSKQLTAKARDRFYKILTRRPNIEWGIGVVSEKMIDKLNILQATKLAMAKAIDDLGSRADFLILDGRMSLNVKIPQKSIVKADAKVFSCACASVIAKVTRDRIMRKYHRQYPLYRFDQHVGYPTKLHRRMLKKHGPSKIHRKSFIA